MCVCVSERVYVCVCVVCVALSDQWSPVGVQVANPKSWDELSESNHQKVEVQKKPELLEQNLEMGIQKEA